MDADQTQQPGSFALLFQAPDPEAMRATRQRGSDAVVDAASESQHGSLGLASDVEALGVRIGARVASSSRTRRQRDGPGGNLQLAVLHVLEREAR